MTNVCHPKKKAAKKLLNFNKIFVHPISLVNRSISTENSFYQHFFMNFCPSKLFHCLQVTEFPQYFLGSTIQLINKCSVSPMVGLCSHASVIVLNLYKLVSKQFKKPPQNQMGEHGPLTVWH